MIFVQQLFIAICKYIFFFEVNFISLLWLWVLSYFQKGIPNPEIIKTKTNSNFSSYFGAPLKIFDAFGIWFDVGNNFQMAAHQHLLNNPHFPQSCAHIVTFSFN